MKRAALLLGLISLMWLAGACSGGGSDDNNPDAGPLSIDLLWAEPATGASPLRVVFTANITGGMAPYYYSWDYTNDGSVDTYINGEFRRTISVANNYYYRASDPEFSIYNAVLTVTDSVGDSVTSDPVQVNVLGEQAIILDHVGPTSDFQEWDEAAQQLLYIYRSGQPVYFSAVPTSGTPPYSYHWDFDADGTVDSTMPNPQYTYSNTTGFVILNQYTLEIRDANDERIFWDGYFNIQPEDPDIIDPIGPFDIIVNTTPEVNPATGKIHITYDPLGGGVNMPAEPELDMAVIVNQNNGGGTPPFEYYWDFENDGSLDSQALSPTIPYYDTERLILINPYLSQEEVAEFTLRCMVIDSAGIVQTVLLPVVVRQFGQSLDPIEIVATYGISENKVFTKDPPVPYAEAGSRASLTEVTFNFTISGSTDDYEFQFDGNGDGNPDEVDVDYSGPDKTGDGTPDTMVGGWYPIHGTTFLEFTVPYEGVDYFPTVISVRGVDTAGNEADGVTYNMPVSLVSRAPINLDAGVLDPRRDHCITANWTTQPHATNGQMLAEREFTIAGGRQGTSVKNTVQRLFQGYDPPGDTGLLESLNLTEVTDRSPINQERFSSVMWTQSPETGSAAQIRIHGGANVINGMLVSNETSTGGAGSVPWMVIGELLIPEFYPLMDMAGTQVDNSYVLAGGLHQPADEDNPLVSRKLISYDPVMDAYGDMTSMGTARYDCSVAYANGLIYVIGGRESNGGSVATMEAYNPTTGGWLTFAPQMHEARSGAICQVIGGEIYMIGGAYWPPNESDPVILDTAEVFNPATGVWSYTLPLPNGIFNENAHKMASVAVPSPGGVAAGGASLNSIVCFGGEGWDGEGDTSLGEINRLYEFTYFFSVPLPTT